MKTISVQGGMGNGFAIEMVSHNETL